jgi:predicted glycoside hydrolase/deacetylase ChbG (UPF0249 family)
MNSGGHHIPAAQEEDLLPLWESQIEPSSRSAIAGPPPVHTDPNAPTGRLIINADDWGRDRKTTEATFECVRRGTVSAVSAMVFMEDSERAAEVARASGMDAGLHLNFTAPFTARECPPQLAERQGQLAAYLQRHPLARVLFNPWLAGSFEYVVKAQLDHFVQIYGAAPRRIDGHHHLHLCANVQRAQLLPAGTRVRRNFSFQPGEKSWINRSYRKSVDRRLARRHSLVDFLFQLLPLQPASRLQRIFFLARQFAVELETHPVNPEEFQFLMGGEIFQRLGDMPVVRFPAPTGAACHE